MAGTTRLELATSAVTVTHSLDSTESIGYVGNNRQTMWFVGMVGSILFNELFNAYLSSGNGALYNFCGLQGSRRPKNIARTSDATAEHQIPELPRRLVLGTGNISEPL